MLRERVILAAGRIWELLTPALFFQYPSEIHSILHCWVYHHIHSLYIIIDLQPKQTVHMKLPDANEFSLGPLTYMPANSSLNQHGEHNRNKHKPVWLPVSSDSVFSHHLPLPKL